MKNAVVIFNSNRQHTYTGSKGCMVCLNPGNNVVSIDKLEQLDGESETFVDAVSSGEIEILEKGVVKAETKNKNEISKNPLNDNIVLNITEMGAREAIIAIDAEIDTSVLNGYLADERANDDRKTVVKAIEKAIKSLGDDTES